MMEKINMKLEVVKVLDSVNALADFSTDYPEEMAVFPYAVYRTTATPHFINGDREEEQTHWKVFIEVYGTRSVSSVTKSINDKLRELGFSVIQRDSNTAGLFRIVLEANGIVDNKMKIIYL